MLHAEFFDKTVPPLQHILNHSINYIKIPLRYDALPIAIRESTPTTYCRNSCCDKMSKDCYAVICKMCITYMNAL